MSETNRRETDAQVFKLFFIATAVFIAVGAVLWNMG